jgi:CheY-like chemotaxis protein
MMITPAESIREKSRVLIVDDDTDSAEVLCELLLSEGHAAAIAHDGAQALARMSSFEPEFVLLDLDLRSDADGRQVCRRLIAAASRKRPCIIAMTGALNSDEKELHEAGFDAQVTKPIPVERLLKLLSG